MIDPKHKKWIDNATYKELLRRWRFAPLNDPIFIGDFRNYYQEIMEERKSELPAGADVRISKEIGWVNHETNPNATRQQ